MYTYIRYIDIRHIGNIRVIHKMQCLCARKIDTVFVLFLVEGALYMYYERGTKFPKQAVLYYTL